MQNFENQKLYNAIISSLGGKVDSNAVKKAQKGDFGDLISSLPKEDAKKLTEALEDKEKARQLLSSEAAKNIIDMLFGGKNDGRP